MKNVLLTVAMLLALTAVGHAGPEAYSGKEMKQVASVPRACPDWTGFYAGAFGGYKFSNVDTDLTVGGAYNLFPPLRESIEENSPGDLDNDGGEAGGLGPI